MFVFDVFAKFKLSWREAGPPNNHDDEVDLDQSPIPGMPVQGQSFEVQSLRLGFQVYRGTSLIRKCIPLGPHRRPMPRVLK